MAEAAASRTYVGSAHSRLDLPYIMSHVVAAVKLGTGTALLEEKKRSAPVGVPRRVDHRPIG